MSLFKNKINTGNFGMKDEKKKVEEELGQVKNDLDTTDFLKEEKKKEVIEVKDAKDLEKKEEIKPEEKKGTSTEYHDDPVLSALSGMSPIANQNTKAEEGSSDSEKTIDQTQIKELPEEAKSEENIEKDEKKPEIKVKKTNGKYPEINEILQLAIDNGVSDIHFGESSKVALRIDGKISFIKEIEEIVPKQMEEYISYLLMDDKNMIKKFKETKELDCGFEHESGINFRINLFYKRRKASAVLRKIESEARSIEELGIPQAIKKLLEKKQGLLLVTGPTGSGKSTSMQAMLNYVNENRVEHILTIEDPVEFIFENNKSVFSQREVGPDTLSFKNALKAALREDPDVIMIGELRDAETIEAAMHLAETGHLVISTLHTSSAAQTISRLVSNFPSDEQDQVQSRLADSLIGVLSQRLVPKAGGKGRIGIFEVLIVNGAVRNIIRTGDMGQMQNAMLSGRSEGMVMMRDYADELAAQRLIDEESYAGFFRNE